MSVILLLHTILMALTFGNFQLLNVDYHSIDEPIVQLNNHTLREVFEPNLILQNQWFTYGSSTISNITNGVRVTSNFTGIIRIVKSTTITNTNKYYFNGSYKANFNEVGNAITTRKLGTLIQTLQNTVSNNTIQVIDKIYTMTANANELSFGFQITSGQTVDIYNTYFIDMTSHGISSLTVEQMDAYFNEYQNNIGVDDVTYTINEHDMTDLIILLGFGFSWVGIFWILRKVIS